VRQGLGGEMFMIVLLSKEEHQKHPKADKMEKNRKGFMDPTQLCSHTIEVTTQLEAEECSRPDTVFI
jgi:hypothetical protein